MRKKLLTCLSLLSISAIGLAQTTFEPKATINANTGANPYVMDSGHIDGDAYADIIIGTLAGNTVEWYKNNGDKTFSMQTLISTTLTQVSGVKIADLNNDGNNDIIATSFNGGKLVWFENNGTGGFGTEQIISNTVAGAGSIVTGTIDAGTTIDVAIVAYSDNKVVWFSNNGSGVFGSEQTITSTLTEPGDLDLKDFDGDTDLDVVVATSAWAAGVVEVFYNDGTGAFTQDINSVSTTGNTYLFDVSFADVNDDGVLDILVTDDYGEVAWYNKDVSGTYTQTIISTSMANPGTATAADLDNDTYNDIVVSNGGTALDDLVWFKSNSSGALLPEISIDNSQHQVFAKTINDFDNDGDLDIATVDYQNNHLNWFENKLTTLSTQNNSIQELTIYPNPTTNSLYFKGNITEDLNVSVYNVLGKQVLNATVNQNQALDVSKLNNGVYIIKFNNYNSAYKFVKQ
ncbi:T9SS type A sorting domain-containing protein [Lacinutrix gracilariae]|uniref:T9SS type A sorting domain-containing protein n=1 Tax=Lacinutrix gracilariae TaxID=1747198 RepID=A0ABW5K183_9FLAO